MPQNNKIKTHLLIFFCLMVLLLLPKTAKAMPARDVKILAKQPNGITFYTMPHGDEWVNWMSDEKGNVLVEGSDSYWYYAALENSKIKATEYKYLIDNRPDNAATNKDISANIKCITETKYSSESLKSIQNKSEINLVSNFNQKLLILLVSFNDRSLTYSKETWHNEFFGTSADTVNAYYNEISNSHFQFLPAEETEGTANDGIISVKLNYDHPNTQGNTDSRNQQLVKDALTAANQYIDFTQFDTNGNGYIETDEIHIVTIIAGYEASYNQYIVPSVWGHRWSLFGNYTTYLDGKYLCYPGYGGYTQQGEIHGNGSDDHMATIGVFCHELGHDLGLPDLYDYDGSSAGIGVHSLMASGSWGTYNGYDGNSPTHMDAWCKVKLGFTEPVDVTSEGNYNVYSVPSMYNVLKIPTQNNKEYFLIENREFSGFDQALSRYCISGGIAIWHIDENICDINDNYGVNNDEMHKAVDLEEANEAQLGYSQLDNNNNYYLDNYFYIGNNNIKFNQTTRPNSNLYSGTPSAVNVDISSTPQSSMNVHISSNEIPTVVVNFKDENLEKIVRNALNKPTGDITNIDMLNLTDLWADYNSIKDLTGLEYAANLRELYLENNSITDLAPISKLSNLYLLWISDNKITSLSALNSMNSLRSLNISNNPIVDFTPLQQLTGMDLLYASNTGLTNLSCIGGMTNLRFLNISNNKIINFSLLSNFTNLYNLDLSATGIYDLLPLKNMTLLNSLNISNNKITSNFFNVISNLTNIQNLRIAYTGITDISSLVNFQNLYDLDLSGNNITNLSTILPRLTTLTGLYIRSCSLTNINFLSGLVRLNYLDISNNNISDISPLSGLINMHNLSMESNKITNLNAISGLVNIIDLEIGYNSISDITPLSRFTLLNYLFAEGDQISDISTLSNLKNLAMIILGNNKISDVTPLQGLPNLSSLYLYGNNISDFGPIFNISSLWTLDIADNPASSISGIDKLTNLEDLYAGGLNISDFSPVASLSNLKTLSLDNNNISDINFLQNLNGLNYLNLAGNNISDILPLSNMTGLKQLSLSANNITDIKALVSLVSSGAFKQGINQTTILNNDKNVAEYIKKEQEYNKERTLQKDYLDFGWGDSYIDVRYNKLDVTTGSNAYNDIQTIKNNGITIYYQPQKGNELTIASTNPQDNAVDVPVNNFAFKAVFNKAIAKGTTFTGIVLKDDKGNTIASTVSISGNTLTIKPSVSLKYNTQYTVTLPQNSLRDYNDINNILAEDNYFTFKTVDILSIASTSPANNGKDVLPSSSLAITYDRNISSGPTFANITLKSSSGQIVSTKCNVSGNILTITPDNTLNYKTVYTLTVPKDAAVDAADSNVILSSDYKLTFTTVDKLNAAIIVPKNGDTNVATDKQASITFDRAIAQGNDFGNITMKDANGNNVNVTCSIVAKVLNIKPVSKLLNNTVYNINIPKSAVCDALNSNVVMDKDLNLGFTTAEALGVIKTVPEDAADDVKTTSTISVMLNKNITYGPQFKLIALKDKDGNIVKATCSVYKNTLNIKPYYRLNCLENYTVFVPYNAVCDAACKNSYLSNDYSFGFKTTDDVAPFVITNGMQPKNGAYNVARDTDITIAFSEDVIKTENFKCYFTDGNKNNIDCSISIDGNNLIINPTSNLYPMTNFTISIPKNALSDNYNNVLTKDILLKFKSADSPLPYVKTARPSNMTQNVNVKSYITLTFNKPITANAAGGYDSIKLVDEFGKEAEITKKVYGSILYIYPVKPLDYYRNYTITIPNDAVLNSDKQAMEYSYSLTFKTQKLETVPPYIKVTSPVQASVYDKKYSLVFAAADKSLISNVTVKREIVDPVTKKKSYIDYDPVLDSATGLYTADIDISDDNTRYTLIISASDIWDNTSNRIVYVTKQKDYAPPIITFTAPKSSSASISNILTSYQLNFKTTDILSGIQNVHMLVKTDNNITYDDDLYTHADGTDYLKSDVLSYLLDGFVKGQNSTTYVTVTAYDRDGHKAVKYITIRRVPDVLKPTATWVSPRSSYTTITGDTVNLHFTAKDESGLKSLRVKLNGVEITDAAWDANVDELVQSNEFNFNVSGLIKGSNKIEIFIEDNSNNPLNVYHYLLNVYSK